MRIADNLLAEINREAVSTTRLLQSVPLDKLDWAPHPRSMSLGQLAWHIAGLPKRIASFIEVKTFDLGGARPSPALGEGSPVDAYRKNVGGMTAAVGALEDADIMAPFTMVMNGETVTQMPIAGMIRTIGMNHVYHHRGQLTVYLRLLDVPVPAMYGRSADENPFG